MKTHQVLRLGIKLVVQLCVIMEWKRTMWFAISLAAAELLAVGVISGRNALAGEVDSMGVFLVFQIPILAIIPLYFARRIHRLHFLYGFSAGVLSALLLVIVILSVYGIASLLSWPIDGVDAAKGTAIFSAFLLVSSPLLGVAVGFITWGISKKLNNGSH